MATGALSGPQRRDSELEDLGLLEVEPDVEEVFNLIKGRIVQGGKEA